MNGLLKPLVRAIRRGLDRPLSSLIGIKNRFYAQGDAILKTHMQTVKPVVLSGNFEVTFKFATSSTAASQYIVDNTGYTNRFEVMYNSIGEFVNRTYGSFYVDGAPTNVMVADSNWHEITFKRNLMHADQGDKVFDLVGISLDVLNGAFNGRIADLKAINGDGTVVADFALDKGSVESQYKYGAEKVSNGTFDTGVSGWGTNGSTVATQVNGAIQLVTTGVGQGVTQVISGITQGATYLISLDVVGGDIPLDVRIGDGGSDIAYNYKLISDLPIGHYEFTVTATEPVDTMNLYLRHGEIGTTLTDNVSVKEITNYQEVQSSKDIEYMKGTTFGSELVVNGNADNGIEPWTGSLSLAVDNGRFKCTQSDTYAIGVQPLSVVAGSTYKVHADIEDGTAEGTFMVKDLSNSSVVSIRAGEPPQFFTAEVTDSFTTRIQGGNVAGDFYIGNVSIREITSGNILEYKNTDEDTFQEYTLESGYSLGITNLVDLSAWTYPTGFSLLDSEVIIDNTVSAYNAAVESGGTISQGESYTTSYTYTGTGNVRFRAGNSNYPADYSPAGKYTDSARANDDFNVKLQVDGSTPVGVFSDVEVKHKITNPVTIPIADIQRYMVEGDTILKTHMKLLEPQVYAGKFRVGCYCVVSDDLTSKVLLGSGTTNDLLYTDNGGVRARLAGGSYNAYTGDGSEELTIGKVVYIELERDVDDLVTVYINGSPTSNQYTQAGTVTFDRIMERSGGIHWDSIIFDTYFQNELDERHTFPINRQPAESLYEYGSEEWSEAATLGGQWVNVSDEVYACDSTATSNLTGSTSLVNNTPYEVKVKVVSISGGRPSLVNGSVLDVGENTQVIIPTIGQAIISAANAVNCEVSNISVREITNYQSVHAAQDYEYSDGTTFGAELWDDNAATFGSQWVYNGGGSYTLTGDGGFNQLADTNILTPNEPVEVTLTVSAITGFLKVFAGSTFKTISTVGVHRILMTDVTQTLLGFARDTGVVNATISNISVQKVNGKVLEYINADDDNCKQYTLMDNGWLSEELVTSGKLVFDGTEGGYSSKALGFSTVSGATYHIKSTNVIIDGRTQMSAFELTYWTLWTVDSFDAYRNGNGNDVIIQVDSNGFTGEYDTSIKRLIGIA